MDELNAEVEAIIEHRADHHQPCCVEHPDGSRSRCDIETLIAYILAKPAVGADHG